MKSSYSEIHRLNRSETKSGLRVLLVQLSRLQIRGRKGRDVTSMGLWLGEVSRKNIKWN